MFILTTIEDLIQIPPRDFGKPSAQALKDAINAKYSNKIIQKVGLCLCMWDLLQTSEGLIGHGTGLVNVNVEFRMTVFRPFRGEILYGRIKSANEEGIVIDLDFTSEVFIPHQNLFENSTFDEGESTWIWRPEGGAELFFDKGEPVLFRVEQEEWIDQKPTMVRKNEQGEVEETRDTAWRLIGSMNQSGLGPTLWWEEAGGEEAGEEDGDVDMDGAGE
ncbi:DNA-directed RNA polymeras-like protein III 25 kDa polypeptide [Trematosphaeria pertusa]|uniref:DNA-directed RNA polymerase subunit n=1 Tax=Trematosphaeria pertusa TaxID=390896 RepID=A0A6A6ISN4_9PLEO|nr:DNA-directed RNA polymeras-like protein III 25 kDa polypeptide [Trematosphaeria pertusa]KAF2253118.1 DNA-directed RNA polymeras-like protein III 25 kDa polypeptide [Trematosphaeria pertusa]